MSLWLLKRIDPAVGDRTVDGIETALVEAADLQSAKDAAQALDSRLQPLYWEDVDATEIQSDTGATSYDGGLFRTARLDNGVS